VTDGLTGLFNHRHFWNLLNTELTRVDLYRGDLALILVDLDDFKRVNDQFGHAVGDLLLQSIARLLGESVRDTDIVARYGGEEFTILMPDTNLAARGAGEVAEKIRRAVETLRFKVPETDITLRVTVSIGVSIYRGNRRDFFNDADRALYRSKAEGKNRIHVFSEGA
jgi:diguanylate cyclase (GGDEF)-like protein